MDSDDVDNGDGNYGSDGWGPNKQAKTIMPLLLLMLMTMLMMTTIV